MGLKVEFLIDSYNIVSAPRALAKSDRAPEVLPFQSGLTRTPTPTRHYVFLDSPFVTLPTHFENIYFPGTKCLAACQTFFYGARYARRAAVWHGVAIFISREGGGTWSQIW